MNPERWRKLEEVFEAAICHAPQERARFLEEVCGDDTQLLSEVESLLAHDGAADSFLEPPDSILRVPAAYATLADSSASLINQMIGAYKIVRVLGEGGMGTVYLAEDDRLGRMVALKLLPEMLTVDADRVRRFRLEARAASALNHPNILTIYDIGHTGRGHYIVSEFVEGQTLRQCMANTMTLGTVLDLIAQVASALKAAHRAGIVHRDIKPENIILRPDGYVKVLDFGIAKLMENAGRHAAITSSSHTLPGILIGTPSYMSPEQVKGEAVDARSDLFALGVVLYECLTGRPAFPAPGAAEIFDQVLSTGMPPACSTFNPDVSSEIDRITLKALAKPVTERYQTADELIEDLHRVRDGLTGEQRHLPVKPGNSAEGSITRLGRRRAVLRSIRARTMEFREAGGSRRQSLILLCSLGVVILMLLAVGMRTTSTAKPVESVAVLPFADEGGSVETDYVGEGFTDSLIFNISQLQLPKFKVISRQSVLKYKGSEVDPVKVGSELNVNSVVVGTISRRGGRLHLLVELIDTRDRSQLWFAAFEGDQADMLSLQGNIARKIAERLKVGTGNESDPLPSFRPSMNADAYNLYIKGRWHWNKFTPEGARQATLYYQQAIDLDPTFALAYAGLADVHVLNSRVPSNDSYMRAKAAAEKALAMDSTLGEAHATLGFVKSHYEHDWSGAEAEFKLAMKLNPSYATTYHWYGSQLLAQGKFEQAVREINHARELDPLSPIISAAVGGCYLYARRYDQAAQYFANSKEVSPDFFLPYLSLGRTYTLRRMLPEAVTEYEKALSLSARHSLVLATVGYTYAVFGKEPEARKVLRELETTSPERVSPYRFALVFTGLGDKDAAFAWLHKAYEERDVMLIHVNVDPFFDSLRDDPRFDQLLTRMNLAPRRPES